MRIKYFTMLQNMPIFQLPTVPTDWEIIMAPNAVKKVFGIKPNLIQFFPRYNLFVDRVSGKIIFDAKLTWWK